MKSCAGKGGQWNQKALFVAFLLVLVTILRLQNIFHVRSMFPNGRL